MSGPSTFSEIGGDEYVTWWRERFGLPGHGFADFRFFRRGKSTVWIAAPGVVLPSSPDVEGVGIPFVRLDTLQWKPTGVAVIEFGGEAVRNVIDVDADELAAFIAGEPIAVEPGDPRREILENGYVIVRYRGIAAGCGLCGRESVDSQVSKGRRIPDVCI